MEIGSRGGGNHLQGLLVGAVVLTLVHLVHLVRVTAQQVTISNEEGLTRRQYSGAYILDAPAVVLLAIFLPNLGLALLLTTHSWMILGWKPLDAIPQRIINLFNWSQADPTVSKSGRIGPPNPLSAALSCFG